MLARVVHIGACVHIPPQEEDVFLKLQIMSSICWDLGEFLLYLLHRNLVATAMVDNGAGAMKSF